MSLFQKTFTLALGADDADGICESQSALAAGSLTIDGALSSASVATMDVARRVLITSAGDDSGITFTVTGTDRHGRAQSETLTGANTSTVQSTKDFLTVTDVYASAATASTVTVGTSTVGSSDAMVVDVFANPCEATYTAVVTGTVNFTVQKAIEDLSPNWDLANNDIEWFSEPEDTGNSADTSGKLIGPMSMIRLLINSGTGSVTLRVAPSFGGGGT